MNARELRYQRGELIDRMTAINDRADAEHRDLNGRESSEYQELEQRVAGLDAEIRKAERNMPGRLFQNSSAGRMTDSDNAFVHYLRTGDKSALYDVNLQDAGKEDGLGEYDGRMMLPRGAEYRAVDSTMNITTPADGGSAVPTGLAPTIAARRAELRLSDILGIPNIPGVGTTVNAPYQNANAVVLATTSEQADNHANNYERDAPVLGSKALTLVKKTKKVELTEELLDDENAAVLEFVGNWIGQSIAMTHNSMLLTEVAANGTSIKTFASGTAIAVGELEDIVYDDTLGNYLDGSRSCAWVMKPSTLGAIKSLTGDSRQYGEQTLGSVGERQLLTYPVHYSAYATTIGTTAKSVYFGNWSVGVGMRENPALRFIRDPYSVDGLVILKYTFRAVYGVIVQPAIGYGVHPSA